MAAPAQVKIRLTATSVCTRCHRRIIGCNCPDIDARLRALAQSDYIEIEICAACNRAKLRCTCDDPHRAH